MAEVPWIGLHEIPRQKAALHVSDQGMEMSMLTRMQISSLLGVFLWKEGSRSHCCFLFTRRNNYTGKQIGNCNPLPPVGLPIAGVGPFPVNSNPLVWCRSTKRASKARRDLINAELQTLRSLLPFSAQEKERLSYLHTMALVCLQIRGSQLFPPGPYMPAGPAVTNAVMPDLDLLSLLPGFILAVSADGKLAYISENITQILGFSVVELLAQGDSIFDLLDNRAHETLQKKLHAAQEQPGTEIAFVSEMRTSRSFRMKYGGNRAVAVRGRFLALNRVPTSSILTFIAFCTPITQFLEDGHDASNDVPFYSQHTLNMRVTDVTESVVYHLGYQREELIGQSWYALVHPEDIGAAAALHETLVCDPGSCHQHLMVRMLCKDLSWTWMGITASRGHGREIITCTNVSLRYIS
ncbi:PREDICTED: neuronal PAS domain-containing protein 4 [Crocodylus porosus]|uniref:neuronal PAS domain-containing protein 4 n=1 Tax=Crocodylus porosus TaxID=8502 RepID=UPI0009402A91|nr:PREDICTED: neuronal PAS domain-containing protein 4 [Crocodylus porosus]